MTDNIVLLGANGMLGTEVRAVCADKNLKAFDLPEFDITDKAQLSAAINDASVVINCAAFTDVEKAESQYESAYKVNAEAVENLAQIAAEKGIYVIHISTDFVFDGRKDSPYEETDVPRPINAYGKSKLEGELMLMENHQNCAIIRIEWTYGKNGNHFIKKLLSQCQQHKSVKVVDDQFGSPTSTQAVAEVLRTFAEKKHRGLFHYAAAGYASRYEAAKFAVEKLNLQNEIVPCRSSEFKTVAQRPLNSRFCCEKIEPLLDGPIEMWQKPLERFLEKIKN